MPRDLYARLVMPCHGNTTMVAGRGFFRASSGSVEIKGCEHKLRVSEIQQRGSLLANIFNYLWCFALNDVANGGQVDYFAMQHADVEPEAYWLDRLIAELEANDLDVLGVVIPIKTPNGLTSTALARDDGDTWRPHCRLTLRESHSLPQPFTKADTGRPVLINTGLWVCRFDPAWAKKVYFTINDRIVYDTKRKLYVPEVEPEDWFISRLFHELGLKVGATTSIQVTHEGSIGYSNDGTWGTSEYDAEYVTECALPNRDHVHGFLFPGDVPGWLSYREGRALYELARNKRVLEIGSYCGRSTICLAQSAESVMAVDPMDGRGTPHPRPTGDAFWENLRRYELAHKVSLRSNVGDLNGYTCDLAFVDGAHDAASVRFDFDACLQRLAPGGLIAFHDYRKAPGDHDGRWDPGVSEFVNALIQEGAVLVHRAGTLAVIDPLLTLEGTNG